MTDSEVAAARRDLARSVEGMVFGVDDSAYQTTMTLDNGRIHRPPYLVVAPSSTKDIAATVKYCGRQDIRLTTKSGGHGANGYCLNSDGVVLDLVGLNHIRPHEGGARLTAGMGTRWIQLYSFVQEKLSDRIVVGGGCGEVGLGGFLLGGGFSFVSRSYGLGCDSVTGMEFVSAAGDIHRLRENLDDEDGRDLYWALRGVGGGNFGIVSEVDLDLHKRPSPDMLMGSITFSFDRARELLSFYNAWISALPNEMAVYGLLRSFPDPRRGNEPVLSLRFTPVYNGPFSEGMRLLKPLLDMSPSHVDLYAMTLPQWESFIGNGTMIQGRSTYVRSGVMAAGSFRDDVVEILLRHMSRAPSADSYIVWTHAGGAIAERRRAASSCFAHRDAGFVFELKSIWASNAPQDIRANVEWAVAFFDDLETHVQGAYLNYIDPLLEHWQRKYYGASYERLLRIKERWDPKGRFGFQQGVGSAFQPSRTVPLDISAIDRT